jgi:acyl-CoA synthetase (NDP forming)
MLEAKKKYPKKLFVLCGGFSAQNRRKMEMNGFLIFEEPHRAITAISALVHFSEAAVKPRTDHSTGRHATQGPSSPS